MLFRFRNYSLSLSWLVTSVALVALLIVGRQNYQLSNDNAKLNDANNELLTTNTRMNATLIALQRKYDGLVPRFNADERLKLNLTKELTDCRAALVECNNRCTP